MKKFVRINLNKFRKKGFYVTCGGTWNGGGVTVEKGSVSYTCYMNAAGKVYFGDWLKLQKIYYLRSLL